MGTVIGAGAALTTGNASDIPKFVGGGALAGYAVGNTAANMTGRVVRTGKMLSEQPGNIRNAYEEETYGLNEARKRDIKRQNEIRKKNFMRDELEQKRYHDIAAKLSKNGKTFSTNQVMEAAWDIQKAGISDEKLIEKVLKVEAKREGTIGSSNRDHEKIINVAQEAGAFDRSYIYNDKKRQELEDSFYYNLKNNEKDEIEAMKIFADLQEDGGAESYMKLRSTRSENKKRQERRGTSNPQESKEKRGITESANDRKAKENSSILVEGTEAENKKLTKESDNKIRTKKNNI